MELTIGADLNLNGRSYQNYDLNGSNFLPFGFSGAVINRNGDNITATLVFPNNSLSRSWASEAANNIWIATVNVRIVDQARTLYSYVGQVSSASWDEETVKLELSTILDAVGADVPFRTLSSDLVGPLPTSANVRVY